MRGLPRWFRWAGIVCVCVWRVRRESTTTRLLLCAQNMPNLTFITRLRDGLPLAESIGDEKDHRDFDTYKSQAKQLFIKLRSSPEGAQSFESGGSVFQYDDSSGPLCCCVWFEQDCSTCAG